MGKKILVVDDEPDMRVFMTTLLETSGYDPISAVDGREGLEVARKKRPALILLDVMMPSQSGIAMYRELKTDPELRDIPVIIVSALSKKTFFHSQRTLDAYNAEEVPEPAAYIEKPPEAEELLAAVQAILK
jgi:twitching motility two-component system response regulator PilH